MPSPFFDALRRGTGPMTPMLKTDRLLLRPFREEDADAVSALAGNWNVARMVGRVPHPYGHDLAMSWIASHDANWRRGDEIIFCMELDGDPIGAIGLTRAGESAYSLGYWLGEPWWGKGFATEAARRIIRFAFEELGAEKLTAGHFHDNPASGRVLDKCSFRYTGKTMEHCEARGEAVAHRNFERMPDEGRDRAVAP